MDNLNAMTGPEFLDAIADQEAANGNDINAHYYRERAIQWKADRIELQRAQVLVADLEGRLTHIAEHAAGNPAPLRIVSAQR